MQGMDPLAQGHLPRWLGLQVALGARVSHWLQRLVIFVALMKEGHRPLNHTKMGESAASLLFLKFAGSEQF